MKFNRNFKLRLCCIGISRPCMKMPKKVYPKVSGCERVGMVMIGLLKVFFKTNKVDLNFLDQP